MASLTEQILLMKKSLDETEKELKELEGGRKASAPRARKSLQALKQSSHQLRKQITESVKSMPVKKRTKKSEEVLPMEEIKQLQAEPEEVVEEKPKRVRKANKKKSVEA